MKYGTHPKFGVSAKDLQRGLQLVGSAVNTKDVPSPVLKNVMLTAREDNRLHLAMTDNMISAQYEIACGVDEPGTILLEHGMALDIAKGSKLSNFEFSRSQGQQRATVLCGGTTFRLSVTDPEMFPSIPEPVPGEFQVAVPVLNFLFQHSTFAANKTEPYGVVTEAINIEIDEGEIVAIGTDGMRLAIARQPWEGGALPPIVIPKRASQSIAMLTKQFASGEDVEKLDKVSIGEFEDALTFSFGDLFIRALKQQQGFPIWRRVVPSITGRVQINIHPERLKEKIYYIAVMKGEAAVFTAQAGKFEIRENTVAGEAESDLPCVITPANEKAVTSLNAKHLLDYLGSLPRVADDGVISMYVELDSNSAGSKSIFFRFEDERGKCEYVQSRTRVNTD